MKRKQKYSPKEHIPMKISNNAGCKSEDILIFLFPVQIQFDMRVKLSNLGLIQRNDSTSFNRF